MPELKFDFSEGQHFACRDCPSRCCKNWTVDISLADRTRFEKEAWVRERLKETGASFISLGPDHFLLPTREIKQQLQCAFLEDDGLCGLHKRFGHDFLASTCQTFPFDFVEGEGGEVIVVTSQVCPSIRDNYGEALEGILAKKFEEAGSVARKQSPHLILGTKTRLSLRQYSEVFREWEKILLKDPCLPLALALCIRFEEDLAARLASQEEVSDAEFSAKMEEARLELPKIRPIVLAELLFESRNYHHVARVLLAFSCLPLSYPFRSRVLFQGIRKLLFLQGLFRCLVNLLASRGEIDIVYLGEHIPLGKELWEKKVLGKNQWPEIRDYFARALRRRKFSMEPRKLGDILFLFTMSLSSYGFYAKLRAANHGRELPDRNDFKEALSTVEMSVLHQKAFLGGGGMYQNILGSLLKIPSTVPRILTAEITWEDLQSTGLRAP